MSSTKSTPDEPGRGSVATGKQPVEPAGGNGAAPGNGAARPADPPAGDTGTEAGNGATSGGAGGAPAATGKAGAPDGAASGTAASSGSGGSGGKAATPPSEAATAVLRVPNGGGGPATAEAARAEPKRIPPGAPKDDAGRSTPSEAAKAQPAKAPAPAPAQPAAKASTDRPQAEAVDPAATTAVHPKPTETAPPTLAAVPAPAVPSPGPAAAQPPPWRRMSNDPGRVDPGRIDSGRSEPAPSAADRLLDEGPTAFLEAPRYAPTSAGAPAADAPTETGSWARIPRSRPPRQAALQLKRLDPWSVLKLALVLAVVLFFIWLVAVGVLYGVLDGMGVWDRLNGTYADLVSGEAQTGNRLISAGRVFGLAAVVGAINSLLFAVAVTVGAFVYNVCTDLVGGIEVTLSERD